MTDTLTAAESPITAPTDNGSSSKNKNDPHRDLTHLSEQTHLFREIVDARMDSAVKRSEQLSTRAGMLIAAATLSATLLSSTSDNGWIALSVIFTLAAAIVGTVTLFPRKATYLSLSDARNKILNQPSVNAELMYADEQMSIYLDREKSLTWRSWLIRIGFALLGASIFARVGMVLGSVYQ